MSLAAAAWLGWMGRLGLGAPCIVRYLDSSIHALAILRKGLLVGVPWR